MYGNSPEQLNSNYNDEQKSFVLAVGGGAAETAWPTANTTDSYRLRPVAVVSITKE